MDIQRTIRPWGALFATLLAAAALGLAPGCASTDPDESDLPWNTPQPWESSPFIPGLDNR